MTSLLTELSAIVGQAFADEGLDASFGKVIVSDRPDLAQFQSNGAMAAAKAAKKNPRQVAEAVIARLSAHPAFEKLDIAGPGFINIVVKDAFLSQSLSALAKDPRAGAEMAAKRETIVLDYGGPNIAKPMHVGHLRSGIIGDSIRRILTYAGHKVIGDIHMGDWGTHLGTLFMDYISRGEEDVLMKADLNDPQSVEALFDDMSERYPRGSAAAKEDEALKEKVLAATLKMQNKEAPYYDMWRMVRDASVLAMKKNYGALNVHFDVWKGESDVHDLIAPMVEDLKKRGFAVEDNGAIVVPVKKNDDTKEYPPLILYKRDGAVMYGTTDLATILERMQLYNPSRIVYVVDKRQHLHFEQLFRASILSGLTSDAVELTHIGFGTMNGTDGKPFKTRAGGVMRLRDLIDMGFEKAQQRLSEVALDKDITDQERADIAEKVSVAAIKFADLQNAATADYVFDLERMTSFEGKTGPYILYQAVRIQSLLNKAEQQGFATTGNIHIQDGDRDLALMAGQMGSIVDLAIKQYAPHVLCDYAFRLAQAFSSFYGNVHILSEADAAVRTSRLALCQLVANQLKILTDLLGIAIPARM